MDPIQLTSLLSGKHLKKGPDQTSDPLETLIRTPQTGGESPASPFPLTHQVNQTPQPAPSFLTRRASPKIQILQEWALACFQELKSRPEILLELNRTRRASILHYLEALCERSVDAHEDADTLLRRWSHGVRSPIQTQALDRFFEELIAFYLLQTLILKNWSERGLRRLRQEDLGSLSFVLSNSLLPYCKPGQSDRWKFTHQNRYSWFTPSPRMQSDLWLKLETLSVIEESPSFVYDTLSAVCATAVERLVHKRYDQRFFEALWTFLSEIDLNFSGTLGPLKRKMMGYSPTLRDGSWLRSCPWDFPWVGTEQEEFDLYCFEFFYLWIGPSQAPLWATGTGLEVHPREQMRFELSQDQRSAGLTTDTTSPLLKLTHSKLAEMEACQLSIIFEEQTLRANTKGYSTQFFRQQLDLLEYYKKLRISTTSLGILQVCTALTKIRPGGFLIWFRDEPISDLEGEPALTFVLERALIRAEWDFSGIEHHLPTRTHLFPKMMYLLEREPSIERRHAHRPVRIRGQGTLRSHIEVSTLLQEMLQSFREKLSTFHGTWQIHREESPTPQREWLPKWPSPLQLQTISLLDHLRSESEPLASFASVRFVHKNKQTDIESRLNLSAPSSASVRVWHRKEHPQDLLCAEGYRAFQENIGNDFYWVHLPEASWVSPIRLYLQSSYLQQWLEYSVEKKLGHWQLTETLVKFIPIPKIISETLKNESSLKDEFFSQEPLLSRSTFEEIRNKPDRLLDRIDRLSLTSVTLGLLYAEAARMFDQIHIQIQDKLKFFDVSGAVHWRALIQEHCDPEALLPLTVHPKIRLHGTMPPFVPIGRFERLKTGVPTLLLMTESGHLLKLTSENMRWIDILEHLLDGVEHPTWNELVEYLKLPLSLEPLEQISNQLLLEKSALEENRNALELLINRLLFRLIQS